MIKGKVNRNDEPEIPLRLHLNKKRQTFLAIIDTGFNGHINIPEAFIKRTNWQEIGVEEYELASGEYMEARVFSGFVYFDKKLLNIPVLAAKSNDVLIGTKLLKNSVLVVDFKNETVIIRSD